MAKKPTGLSIGKSGSNWTLYWKRAQSYSSQQCQVSASGTGWIGLSTGKKDTSKAAYFGHVLGYVQFRVRGKYNGNWSGWAYATYYVYAAPAPSTGVSIDENLDGRATFSWAVSAGEANPFWSVNWESILVKDNSTSNGASLTWNSSALGWKTGSSGAAEGGVVIDDQSTIIQGESYTRWFRVRSNGQGGSSGYVYQRAIYAKPNTPLILSASAKGIAAGYSCEVEWDTAESEARPVDRSYVQYSLTKPASNMQPPSGINWTDATSVADSKGSDKLVFDINDTLDDDECLFVRVVSQYRDKTTVSATATALVGNLADTGTISIRNISTTNHTVELSSANNSDVPDSQVAVVYKLASDPTTETVVKIIPHSTTGYVTVQCPDWGSEQPSFGTFAFVGTTTEKSTAESGVKTYAIDARMRSKNTQYGGGNVPLPPANVTASQARTTGTIRVTWDWTWSDADSAVLSWADHEDAWESTDQPSTYTVSNMNTPQWNISGLETGKTWYIRVKLMSTQGEAETSSPWSGIVAVDLSSAPVIPSLSLSKGVVAKGDTFTASWSYLSTDGTTQAYAEICEATRSGSTITYGNIIAHAETGQSIDLNVDDLGWEAGQTKLLCVRVTASSGRKSEGWSEPASIIIAEQIEANITQTSLELTEIEVNGHTVSGDIVTFESDDPNVTPIIEYVKAEITPVQDLHGYTRPWAGGNGKNKLFINDSSETKNGITMTANSDGSIKLNGTATAYTFFNLNYVDNYTLSIPVGTYYANGGIHDVTYRVYVDGSRALNNTAIVDREFTVPSGATVNYFRIDISTGSSFNNETFYPMVRLTSETDPTWEPYSNICPISGWDDVNVWDDGKYGGNIYFNQLYKALNATNWTTESGVTASYSDGIATVTSTTSGNGIQSASTIPIYANHVVIIMGEVMSGNAINNVRIGKGGVGYITVNVTSSDVNKWLFAGTIAKVTADNNTKHFCYVNGSTYSNVKFRNVMIIDLTQCFGATKAEEIYAMEQAEAGSGVAYFKSLFYKDYYAYNAGEETCVSAVNGDEYRHAVIDLDGTRYGAHIDVTSGVMNVCPYYASYNGETLAGEWISDRDEYIPNTSPTIGAQVVNIGGTTTSVQLTPTQIEALVGENNVWANTGEVELRYADDYRKAMMLKEMPLTVTAEGAGEGGTTTIHVQRAEAYHVDRPDETDFDGYLDETICTDTHSGEGQFTFDVSDLVGSFDDGAGYKLTAIVKDSYGQTDREIIPFEVGWTHQAGVPSGTVEVEMDGLYAKITPVAPQGAIASDTCDVYRLSADMPELILKSAVFGTMYVDPYPAIGGGYRFVTRTKNGDYITEDNEIAWFDVESGFEYDRSIIDFDGEQVELYYNVDLSNTWEKDFRATRYLGGSVKGDWNAGVIRSSSTAAAAFTEYNPDVIEGLRRLAEYEGVCHIRTTDGSSFSADLQVAEDRQHDVRREIANFSITGTRVSPEELDGLTYAEWIEGDDELE